MTPNMDEPTRQVDLGENPVIMNPGTVSAIDTILLPELFQWKVEKHERETPIDKDREKAHETRKMMRRMRWDADWAEYRSAQQREILPKILDLTEETRGNESLLENTVLELAQSCRVGHCKWLEKPALGERDLNPKSFVCTHGPESVKIHGHRKCFVQALIRTRAYLQCWRPIKFVLKSSFDDPKSRWDEGENKWIQVDGYFDFKTGLDGRRDFFELHGKEDRWGYRTQEQVDMYCVAHLLRSHRGRYDDSAAISGGDSR